MPANVEAALTAYRRLLTDSFGARLIALRLFGSYARGDADADSDVDVCVVIADLTEAERTVAIDLAFDAWREGGMGALMSPLVWSKDELDERLGAERRIARDIIDEGIPL